MGGAMHCRTAADGGDLELYSLIPDSVRTSEAGLPQGVPMATPEQCVTPTMNSMILFGVEPGRSYAILKCIAPPLFLNGAKSG